MPPSWEAPSPFRCFASGHGIDPGASSIGQSLAALGAVRIAGLGHRSSVPGRGMRPPGCTAPCCNDSQGSVHRSVSRLGAEASRAVSPDQGSPMRPWRRSSHWSNPRRGPNSVPEGSRDSGTRGLGDRARRPIRSRSGYWTTSNKRDRYWNPSGQLHIRSLSSLKCGAGASVPSARWYSFSVLRLIGRGVELLYRAFG